MPSFFNGKMPANQSKSFHWKPIRKGNESMSYSYYDILKAIEGFSLQSVIVASCVRSSLNDDSPALSDPELFDRVCLDVEWIDDSFCGKMTQAAADVVCDLVFSGGSIYGRTDEDRKYGVKDLGTDAFRGRAFDLAYLEQDQ